MEFKFNNDLGLKKCIDFQNTVIGGLQDDDGNLNLLFKEFTIRLATLSYFTDCDTKEKNIDELFAIVNSYDFVTEYEKFMENSSKYKALIYGIDEQLEYLTRRPEKSTADRLLEKIQGFVETMETYYSQPAMIEFANTVMKNEKLGSLSDLDIINTILEKKKQMESLDEEKPLEDEDGKLN